MAAQQASGEHSFISFDSDSNSNLIIRAHPLHPQEHTRDDAGRIAAMFRDKSAIPDRGERLRATAKLIFDLSKKYEFTTQVNWKSHYISIPFKDRNSRSVHRISKGLTRSSYDKEIQYRLQELNESDSK